MDTIFITGGTGYIGSRIIPLLLQKGYNIKALTRPDSSNKIPTECEIIRGDALDSDTYKDFVKPSKIFIHLIGVSHPKPSKKNLFRSVDLVSVEEANKAAKYAGVGHFIFMSVAQKQNRLMQEYQTVRAEGESLIKSSKINASFIHPWYVLGPGHRWPLFLIPVYKILEIILYTSDTAKKLGLVNINQMLRTILFAVENPPNSIKVYEVQDIKNF